MKKCIIVDDVHINRVAAKGMAEELGFEVECYESAIDAYPHITQGDADVLLLDWHMPQMNGIDFLKKLRSTEIGRNLIVMIYSAIEGKEGIYEALNSTADGFLPKPMNMKDITSNFRKAGLI